MNFIIKLFGGYIMHDVYKNWWPKIKQDRYQNNSRETLTAQIADFLKLEILILELKPFHDTQKR